MHVGAAILFPLKTVFLGVRLVLLDKQTQHLMSADESLSLWSNLGRGNMCGTTAPIVAHSCCFYSLVLNTPVRNDKSSTNITFLFLFWYSIQILSDDLILTSHPV